MSLIGTYGGEDDVRLAQTRITANQAGALVSGGSSGDATVTVKVGQTTTLAPGASATVTNSGTDTDAVFNFGIPQGVAGAKGEQGEQGVQGVQGIQGETGAKGDPGEPGIQGVQGEKGDPGVGAVDGIARFIWTGSQAVPSLGAFNLTSVTTKLNDTIGLTVAPNVIKFNGRGATEQTNMAIRVRINGTIAGSTGTDRFYQAQLRRADGTTVLENINLVKASGTNVANASALFATYVTGTSDQFVTNGFQLWVVSGDDGTLTITSVDVTIYARAS